MNPTPLPGLSTNYAKYSKGVWRVIYAPHIRTLEKVLFTNFDVSYTMDMKGKGTITSNVKFENQIISGHLNAQGRYDSTGEDEVKLVWDRLWTDIGTSGAPLFIFRPKHTF